MDSSKYFHSLLTSSNSNSSISINSTSNSKQYIKLSNACGCYACGFKEINENNEMANISDTNEDDDNLIKRLNDYHTLQNLLLDLRNEYTNSTTTNTTNNTNKEEMIVLEATRDDLIQKIDKMTNNINDSNITLTALNYRKMRYRYHHHQLSSIILLFHHCTIF